ncbi:MAG: TraB/GumN family protein [Verrucomicrobiota bacterium]|nr:TraB/GumN family protein [Verrucomicrobiota bacterium]
MLKNLNRLGLVLTLLMVCAPVNGAGTDAAPTDGTSKLAAPQMNFMRIATEGGRRHLQMSVTEYEIHEYKARITFYAAVHIADPEFYSFLQKSFEKYDAVLMEGIGAGDKYGTRSLRTPPFPANLLAQQESKRASVEEVHDLYDALATGLGLKGQMDEIDFRKRNFVYPDMSYQELEKHLDTAGVDYLLPEEQFIRPVIPMLQGFVRGVKSGKEESSVTRNIIKNLMAEMIIRMDLDAALAGEDDVAKKRREYFRIILEERNQKVVEAIETALKSGKKNIAVFYGAMHLPGIQESLIKDFKAKETGKVWVNAWKLN